MTTPDFRDVRTSMRALIADVTDLLPTQDLADNQ